MLNKMNKIEIYVVNEDTDINPSVQEAIEYVLKQNDPVGTVAGYYDEKLTIWSVSNYFLQLLGWDDLDEFMKASDGSMLSVVCNEQKHIFSPERLHDLQGSHILYLTDSKGLSIPVRIVKADARDNKGRPIWVLSVRSDHFARNQEAREAAFHRAFTDMNLCEYYVDLQENTFESMKVRGSLQEISNKSRTWDELIQMFLNNYVCPESKEAVAQIYNREYIMKELRKITGELSQECKAVFDGELRIIRNVVMEGDTDENGEVRHAMIFLRDVTDSKNAEKERRAMLKQNIAMDQLIQGVTRIVERFAVCDLDRFKPVNDTYGHDMGDRLLKAVSRRLCKCIRKTDYAFRIGGDEFSLIIEEGNINDEFCEMMVRRIKRVIDRPFNIEGRLLSVDTSCGYAIYPEHSQKIDEIRIMADHRMYEDKTQNRKKG